MIETDRLILRQWDPRDSVPFMAMGNDPAVMRFLGPPPTMADATAVVARQNAVLAEHGYCFWATERKADGRFIGFCGLLPAKPPLIGEIEIGWRLASDVWGQGYAQEAAVACLAWAWANLDVPAIAAITVKANVRSWRLMRRLGMTRYADEDFDHPDLPPGDPLRPHIVYRIERPAAT